MSQITKYEPQQVSLYDRIQDPMSAIEKMGHWIWKSAMFGCAKPEEGIILALAAYSEGVSVFHIKQTYHIIEGNLTMKPEVMLARFLARGGRHKIISQTPEKAEIELSKDGETNRFALTWADAQKEPFVAGSSGLKKNWRTPRARMQTMWARVVSQGVRSMDPGVAVGVYTPDEVGDDPAPASEKPLLIEAARPDAVTMPLATLPPEIVTNERAAQPAVEAPAPAPTAVPAQAAFTAAIASDGLLSLQTQAKVMEVIPTSQQAAALDWFIARGWLKEGETLAHLGLKRAQSIIDRPAAFLATIAPQ